MLHYYDKNLSAERLRQVYELATPRVKQYLKAEITFVLDKLGPSAMVLELGCGYGRVLAPLAEQAASVIGIDTSRASLLEAGKLHGKYRNIQLSQMDASGLGFLNGSFDSVVCIQNGVSAFHTDPFVLLGESIRVCKKGGSVIFSSYAESFWEERLEWFRLQAEYGLLGEIDWEKTRDGRIVCADGFTASTYGPDEFIKLCSQFDRPYRISEIDGSCVFCEISC